MKADHAKVKRQLSIAKGQLDGISKMVDQDAYCIDVSNQLLATIALLKRVNNMVISAHLASCVKNAKDGADLDAKLLEIDEILKRMSD
ncbi:MAG: Copper-sensing transcriptional repressor CsoR [Tenericutes bacterium ADurb.BinA155]|jgi:DNA-binding FrmR family transcriptional regulator|nr:MAG: Copper-sensing transcriptional repressor CsoR [Tenericutes bacterium ADurb.BinA155]